MLQKCKPRNLAIVKAKSKRLFQSSVASKDYSVDSGKDDATIVSQSTVAQAMSPLVQNNGIIKPDRFAEATSSDSYEFFYRYKYLFIICILL